MSASVLAITDLKLAFERAEVLHGISLHVRAGEKVALVGESGSGKSVTARLVMGLLQDNRRARIAGRIRLFDQDITGGGAPVEALRGKRLTMIFQDPTSALNPTYRIGPQFRDVIRVGGARLPKAEADRQAAAALAAVEIRDPRRALQSYPFQLSGGMNQRVMIAMALFNKPGLLIADEPGTALDVTVQAQTLHLMSDMAERSGTAVLLISHNLGVVREFADRVYVIYRGRIVEHGTAAQLFSAPRHPYTRALIAAIPKISGGGLPDLPERSPAFMDPLIVHEGCHEPAVAA